MTCRAIFLTFALLLSGAASAIELELVPASFPAAQKPAFMKERASLQAEKKAIDGRVYRYNKQCAHPKEYQVHKCSTERLALFQQVDAYKAKVQDFNKRLSVIDKGLVKKPANEESKKDDQADKKP